MPTHSYAEQLLGRCHLRSRRRGGQPRPDDHLARELRLAREPAPRSRRSPPATPTATRSPTRSPAAPTPPASRSTPRPALLAFVRPPNFELPLDADGDNVYQVTVSVSDGIAAAVTEAVSVTVTDVDETGFALPRLRDGAAPAAIETGDPTDYELGMRFQANSVGLHHRAALLPRRGRRRRHRHPDAEPLDGRPACASAR